MGRPDRGRIARLLASPRNRILLGVAVVLSSVRIALPAIVRPILVERADEALVGHIELEDLDLSLLRGGVTLHEFSLRSDERPSEAPASFKADRLFTQISWLTLLSRTLRIEELEIERFAVRLDRFTEGLRLPKPVASDPSVEKESAAVAWSLAAWIKQYDAGLDVRSTLNLVDVPIGELRAYLRQFDWDELAGNLDASLEHRYEPGGVHEIRGKAGVSDLQVGVDRFEEPALAWQNLEVVIDRVDLVGRHAEIESILWTGAHALVDPRSETPLVLLTSPSDSNEEKEPAHAEPAWTWRVEKASVVDLVVDLRGAQDPLLLRAQAELASLSSDPEVRAPVSLTLTAEQGHFQLAGELALAPLLFDGKLSIRELALRALVSQVQAPALHWLRAGTLRADLALSLGLSLDKSARLSGLLGLAGLDLEEAETAKRFAVEWKDLELAVQEIKLRGPSAGSEGDPARSVEIKLARLRLCGPRFVLTRDENGLVLPTLLPASKGGDPAEAESPTAPSDAPPADAPVESAPLTITLAIADARVEAARGRLADRAVELYYRGRIEALELHATGVRWPANEVNELDLNMKGLRGATLALRGSIHSGKSKLEGELVELPLDQFNPYLASTGYNLQGGTLSLESDARFQPERLGTKSKIVFSALDVGGSQGEEAFRENFGIPLSLAIGLLEDLDGRIVGQALRKALVGALAAPLKLLGAGTRDGKVESLAPEPIAFAPGSSELSTEGSDRAEEIAGLLAASPGISLVLTGQSSESDQRVLRERALLVQLEASRGVRALSALGEISTRRAVRDFLGRSLSGGMPRSLSSEESRWLETAISQSARPTGALGQLADARANRLRELFASEHGIAATRLVVASSRIDPPAPESGVRIALGDREEPGPPTP